jgi:hypothetical protein
VTGCVTRAAVLRLERPSRDACLTAFENAWRPGPGISRTVCLSSALDQRQLATLMVARKPMGVDSQIEVASASNQPLTQAGHSHYCFAVAGSAAAGGSLHLW